MPCGRRPCTRYAGSGRRAGKHKMNHEEHEEHEEDQEPFTKKLKSRCSTSPCRRTCGLANGKSLLRTRVGFEWAISVPLSYCVFLRVLRGSVFLAGFAHGVVRIEPGDEVVESTGHDRVAQPAHQVEVVVQVVDRRQH